MSEVTKKKINELLVSELRAQLEKRKLDASGLKAALIDRLRLALEADGENPQEFLFEINKGNETEQSVQTDGEWSKNIETYEKSVGTESCETMFREKLIVDRNSSGATSNSEIPVIEFNPEAGMLWKSWVTYFEAYCSDHKKDNFWKIRNIQKFLRGKALTLFVNHSLNVLHWEELLDIFNEEFTVPGEVSLSDFSNIRFRLGEDLMEYYHKKVQAARALDLDNKITIQGLTDGLPQFLKQLVVVNAPKTTTEWREIVYKLTKLHSHETSQATFRRMSPLTNVCQNDRQWRPPRNYCPNPRPGNYRFPLNGNPRFNSSNVTTPRGPRPVNVPNSYVHYQQRLPPLPCRTCTGYNIPNAYHWHRNCPFRENNVAPNFNHNINNESTQNNSVISSDLSQSSSGNPGSNTY